MFPKVNNYLAIDLHNHNGEVEIYLQESSSSQLHAIEFVRMEQHFPVLAAYKFAIPQMSSSCICDCAGAEQYCSVETHRYK